MEPDGGLGGVRFPGDLARILLAHRQPGNLDHYPLLALDDDDRLAYNVAGIAAGRNRRSV